MTDFENRVWDILSSDDADHMKIGKIRKLYTPNIDPSACKNNRFYWIVVSGYETIGWRGNSTFPWVLRWRDDSVRFEEDSKVTVLGEYHQEDEYIGNVYMRIEDAVADGMGRYTVLEDKDGDHWTFGSVTTDEKPVTTAGFKMENCWAPFTVLHWVPKEAGE